MANLLGEVMYSVERYTNETRHCRFDHVIGALSTVRDTHEVTTKRSITYSNCRRAEGWILRLCTLRKLSWGRRQSSARSRVSSCSALPESAPALFFGDCFRAVAKLICVAIMAFLNWKWSASGIIQWPQHKRQCTVGHTCESGQCHRRRGEQLRCQDGVVRILVYRNNFSSLFLLTVHRQVL